MTGQASTHITSTKMQVKGDVKDKHRYRHTVSRSGGGGNICRGTHQKTGQVSTHITNAKMQAKGGAKDKHTDTFCHVLGEGETFDEEHIKRTGQASTHITNAKIQTKGDVKGKHSYRHTFSRSGGGGNI